MSRWLVLLALVSPAAASPVRAGRSVVVPAAARGLREAPAPVSRTIYLERCRGSCTIRSGDNDARVGTSMIPKIAISTIGEFANAAGQIGPAADAEWAAVVQCMAEVYSPYDVTVTDQRPGAGASYHEAIIAGRPANVGMSDDVLGAAPLASDCHAIDNSISFTFANQHPPTARVYNVCWTAAQETAHAFGLDHEYAFSNHRSACSDPMTYRADCGGEKFFRDEPASCGETAARACTCGGLQNSHRKLLSVFGPGTQITRPPTVDLVTPAAGDGLGPTAEVEAGAQRGVARVELQINGFAWATAPGAKILVDGQPDPSSYQLTVPADVPDGISDVAAVAYDDLGTATASAAVTLTKGAPCASAATCATGQRCDAGRCLWDPPAGEVGDACSYPQFCTSLRCEGPTGAQRCAETCRVSAATCAGGEICQALAEGSDDGVCVTGVAGCCSATGRGDGWLAGGLAAAVLGWARRRRRPLRSRRPADDDSA